MKVLYKLVFLNMKQCRKRLKKFAFKVPATVLVAGSTHSGKSYLINQILIQRKILIEQPVYRVVYYYNTWQPLHEHLKATIPRIQFRNEIDLGRKPEKAPLGRTIITIFDDFGEALQDRELGAFILKHFLVWTHHLNHVTFFISHNVFETNRFNYQRTLSLNSHYIVCFRNLRDVKQITTLASQVYGSDAKEFMKIYKRVLGPRSPSRYILINCHPCSPFYQMAHVNILKTDSTQYEDLEKIFVPKQISNS